ncbi:L,D-transpeptidase family protein [Hansschlegelia plantiphila]|uniref:L,D-TPase catalytic domain-containing protein n=1 Tax=Hansschlegelia plantiphila TaxID=374655 RepID=A0A9W6J1W0_9HYPH|nr:L,D-transpeptidase family protein [Hansschlegelia plantiphila]GLK67754.1 hypothetical protein GCM10008179_13920 [Hansschlegelia plantiphila]
MSNIAMARPLSRRAGLRRSASAIVLGVALAAAAGGAGRAASGEAETAIPVPDIALPQVGDRDFNISPGGRDATGSIDAETPPTTEPAAPAAQQAPAPAPGSAEAAPIDAMKAAGPVPAAIADLFAAPGAASGLKLSPADRATLQAFYVARQGAPLWVADGRFTPKAEAAKARIAAAADDGLDAGRFRLPDVPSNPEDAAGAARAEIQLSAAALAYAREAWGGRVAPGSVSPSISSRPDAFDATAALASLDGANDVAATLDGFNPQHPQFQALRKLLVEARASRGDRVEHPQIGFGKLLQPGDEDPRVPTLRTRLGLTGGEDDFYYDTELADAVIAFQKGAKIGASGLVNRQTVRALNANARPQDDTTLIVANMERWRWMPRELGAKYVFVDLPAFELHVMQDGRSTYDTRVIIGKASNQTPLLSSAINQIVVNPYWNVPVSIAIKELSQGSLRGFEVVDSRGKVVDAGSIDWESVRAGKMRIRQAPGERNALGHIKFLFPNSHAVYLHDTPSRSLFARSDRAMSHGCVRVDKPLEFADALSGDQGWSGDKLKTMIGGKERGVPLSTTIPVYLTYFTGWVDDGGKLQARNDLYGIDGRLNAALRGEPLPPIPVEALPRIAAKPRPKPAPGAQTATAAPPPPVQQRPGPANWLARIFGDSRY